MQKDTFAVVLSRPALDRHRRELSENVGSDPWEGFLIDEEAMIIDTSLKLCPIFQNSVKPRAKTALIFLIYFIN